MNTTQKDSFSVTIPVTRTAPELKDSVMESPKATASRGTRRWVDGAVSDHGGPATLRIDPLCISKDYSHCDSCVKGIIEKFIERADFGMKKYGTNLDRKDLSVLDWIQHAQEEHMDAILYLEKLKKEISS